MTLHIDTSGSHHHHPTPTVPGSPGPKKQNPKYLLAKTHTNPPQQPITPLPPPPEIPAAAPSDPPRPSHSKSLPTRHPSQNPKKTTTDLAVRPPSVQPHRPDLSIRYLLLPRSRSQARGSLCVWAGPVKPVPVTSKEACHFSTFTLPYPTYYDLLLLSQVKPAYVHT